MSRSAAAVRRGSRMWSQYRCQDPLGRGLVCRRIHRQVIDVPVVQDVAPESHFRGVVPLVDIIQPQLIQGAVGVSAGHDAEYLWVCVLLVGQV